MLQLAAPRQATETGLRILMATSEAHPLIKTGGLADVTAALPATLRELGHDARLIIPAYPRAVKQIRGLKTLCDLKLGGSHGTVRILSGHLPDSDLPTFLVEAPEHFCREGNPYTDVSGRDWGDNAERFLLFCRAIARIGQGEAGLDWRPNVLHCNDWQTGLVPALVHGQPDRPVLIFTVHNLSYQGLFERTTFDRLRLPASLWSVHGLEFHQRLSFIKGGLVFSDLVNTVSPTYAEEVKTPRFGCGLDGLLRDLGPRFRGILNGIDYRVWDPAGDSQIPHNYDARSFDLKVENKLVLQRELGLPRGERTFVLGYIGRLVEQKGIDLMLEILPQLLAHPDTQLIMQGAGDPLIEDALLRAAAANPDRVGVFTGYDEGRAHRIEAGADAFLMPSRFEPCGLNQMYSLRYGTVPIVHRTGGLADTVVDTSPERIEAGEATGFTFDNISPEALWGAVRRALLLYREHRDLWPRLALNGMSQDFSWQASARHYVDLYREALHQRRGAALTG
jgi:starch synthase